jgi:hypothetical protein
MKLDELTNDQMVNTSVKDRLKQKKAQTGTPATPATPAPEPVEQPTQQAAPTGAPAGTVVSQPNGEFFTKSAEGTWATSDEKGNLTGRPAEGPNSSMAKKLEKDAAQAGVTAPQAAPTQQAAPAQQAKSVVGKAADTIKKAVSGKTAPAQGQTWPDVPVGTKALFVKADKYINDPKMRKDVTVIGPSQSGNPAEVSVKDEKNKTFNVSKAKLINPKTKKPLVSPTQDPIQQDPANPVVQTTAPQAAPTQQAAPQAAQAAPQAAQAAPQAAPATPQAVQQPNAGKPVGGVAPAQSTAGMSRSGAPQATIDPKTGVVAAPEPEGVWDKVKRGAQAVGDKITTATGGSLATKTRQDPNASVGKKIGATVGAGLGRAMAGGAKALGNLKMPAGKGKPGTPAIPGQQAPAKPALGGQDHRQLGAWQQKAMQGDVASAKAMVDHLTKKGKEGVDPAELSNYANAVAPVLKRNKEWVQQNQQLYTHLVKLARGMRTEAYEHMCKVLEHAGLTWADLGYKVSIKESNVILFPSKEFTQLEESVAMQEMKMLSGI